MTKFKKGSLMPFKIFNCMAKIKPVYEYKKSPGCLPGLFLYSLWIVNQPCLALVFTYTNTLAFSVSVKFAFIAITCIILIQRSAV